MLGIIFLTLSLIALRQTSKAELERQNAESLLAHANQAQARANLAQEQAAEAQRAADLAQQRVNAAELQIAKEKAQTTAALRTAEDEKSKAQVSRREAELQGRQAKALRLAAQSRVEMDATGEGINRSLLLATESLKSAWTLEGYEMAAKQIALVPMSSTFLQPTSARRTDQGGIQGIAFSGNGRWIATVEGKLVIVREVADGKARELSIEVDARSVPYNTAVSFSSDNRWLAVGSVKGLYVWDTASWRMRLLPGNEDLVRSLAFSPSSRFLASGDRSSKGVRVYQTDTWDELPLMRRDGAMVFAVAFSPDNRWLAVSEYDSVRFWKLPEFQQVYQADIRWVRHLALSPKGDWLAMGGLSTELRRIYFSNDGSVRIPTAEEVEVRRIDQDTLSGSLVFDASGNYLATSGHKGNARVWEVADGEEVARLGQKALALTFSPSGLFIFAGSEDGAIRRWDLGGKTKEYLSHGDTVNRIAFSPDGRWLATACDDRKVHIFNARTYTGANKLQHDEKVSAVEFIAGGRYLVTISGETVRVFEPDNGWREMITLKHKEQRVIRVTFSQDGKFLSMWGRFASSGDQRQWVENQVVWDLAAGRQVESAVQEYKSVSTGRTSRTREQLRDTAQGISALAGKWQEIRTESRPHNSKSTDGLWSIFSNNTKNEVQLKESVSGRLILGLRLGQPVKDFAVSSDNRLLAIACEDGRVFLWPLEREGMIREACARLSRNLSLKEREKYLGDPNSPSSLSEN